MLTFKSANDTLDILNNCTNLEKNKNNCEKCPFKGREDCIDILGANIVRGVVTGNLKVEKVVKK